MTRIYLDHNASSPWRPAVARWMRSARAGRLGNPSSLHREGRAARALVEAARVHIARRLGAADPQQVVFVSGGTEANNLAIHAATQGRPGRAAVTSIEHPAVLRPMAALAQRGWQVETLPVTAAGQVAGWPDLGPGDVLAVMRANNETGTVLDLAAARRSAPDAWLHCDAIQAIGKIAVDFEALGVDTLSVAGHKFGAPLGVGALVVRDPNRIAPLQLGGGQERGLRSGTQAAALIEALRIALDEAIGEQQARAAHTARQRDRLEVLLTQGVADVTVIGDPRARLPNTLCLAFGGVSAEALVVRLDALGVAVATGSACSSGSGKPSHVLTAMGAPLRGVLRISLGPDHGDAEIDTAGRHIVSAVAQLRRIAA
ncbi:MAG: cysteine desulfurase [Deltaproteobacteria bacterium]|nr:cysteine desulfurase [Deltaproteobacteria bacterium]